MSRNINQDSQGNTGTPDITYNLISTIYHTLQGAETVAMYIKDAEQTGDNELVQFFRDLKKENETRANRAKQLLARYIGEGQRQGQAASGS
jgi:hypothetical protein